MPETMYRGRRAFSVENERVRVTVTQEGGHIAEILDKATGVNPMWTPPWPTIEPSTYDRAKYPVYGADAESKLLAGIMGHNLCLDTFGPPSAEEAAAGLTTHGEASVVRYAIEATQFGLEMRATLPVAQIAVRRAIDLIDGSLEITETVENLAPSDRPIAWTEHVTLGPPYIEPGRTQFRSSATRSVVEDVDSPSDKWYLKPGAQFLWPHAPTVDGGTADLQVYRDTAASEAFTSHLMDQARADAFFAAWSPTSRLAIGYLWKTADFPWLGIWEENRARTADPWGGKTITRGLEFGVSPLAEPRRTMIDRSRLFDVPTYRWLPARTRLEVRYWAIIGRQEAAPSAVARTEGGVRFT